MASGQGFTAATAMRIAESLYMRGYISYPRTDNTVYPAGLNVDNILNKLKTAFPDEVHLVNTKRRDRPTRGKTLSKDHPPIHPVGGAATDKLNKQEWKIYDLIVRRFLATFTANARSVVSRAEITINDEVFVAEGYELIEKNWRAIYPYFQKQDTWLDLIEGATAAIEEITKVENETTPPKRYQQGSLLAEMEKNNLGTKSTRHEIIEKLYRRKYIKGKHMRPTLTGMAVTEALKRSADHITKPGMTAELEQEMNEIAEGHKELQEVVADSRILLKEALRTLEGRKDIIGKVIKEAMFKQKFMGRCAACGGNLTMLTSRKGKRFIGCDNFPKCRNSYPLPQRGTILFEDEYCATCRAPIITSVYRRKWKKCVNPDCEGNS
jgi:DNA topoisomerase-1